MSGKCFVDTDILVYAHDRSAGVKHLRAQMLLESLWDSGWGVVSTQVLDEMCIHFCRNANNPPPVEEVRLMVRDYSAWEVVPNTPEGVQAALEIVLRHKVHFWDALILEAAQRAGVSVLYSEHLATQPRYGEILVVNPLTDQTAQ
jgi:predicted nucleic acid-binding protein